MMNLMVNLIVRLIINFDKDESNGAKWGHTFKAFIIIIKTPSYLLKINKRTNKKFLHDSNFEMHFIIMKAVF